MIFPETNAFASESRRLRGRCLRSKKSQPRRHSEFPHRHAWPEEQSIGLECLSTLLGVQAEAALRDIAHLLSRAGGLGLANAALGRTAACWCSWADCLPVVKPATPPSQQMWSTRWLIVQVFTSTAQARAVTNWQDGMCGPVVEGDRQRSSE